MPATRAAEAPSHTGRAHVGRSCAIVISPAACVPPTTRIPPR